MLSILLLLFFLIAEIARAFYLKNSLNNAVRIAVREAVVTPGLTETGIVECPDANPVIDAVCSSPGVPNDNRSRVRITRTEDVPPTGTQPDGGDFTAGDTATVWAESDFDPFVPFIDQTVLPYKAVSEASMRYE